MSRINQVLVMANDPVRIVQVFTLCRQTAIILASIVVARVLPLEEIGIVEMLMFCGFILTFFWSDAFLKGYLAKKDKEGFTIPPSVFLMFTFLGALLIMFFLVITQPLLLPLLTDRKDLPGLTLFAWYQALILPLWLAPFVSGLKWHLVILLSAYVLVGPAFACWAGYGSLPGITGILIGLLSYALVGLVFLMTQLKFFNVLPVWKFIKQVWAVTWPLMLYSLSATMARSLDAWLVAHYYDESVFAIFRYGAREFPLVASLAAGLSTMMIARLLQPTGIGELRERSARLMRICFPVLIVLVLISVPLFQLVFGPEFRESAFIFNVYLLLAMTQLVFPQTIFTSKGETKMLWYVSLLELVVNVVASIMLLQIFGLIGIALGTFIAFAFEKILLLILLKKKFGITIPEVVPVKTWSIYAVLLFIAFFVSLWVFGQ